MFRTITISALLLITLLLIFDFFPSIINFQLNNNFTLIAFIILILVSLIVSKTNDKTTDLKQIFRWQLITPIYLFILVFILTILSGNSDTGISLNNNILWIVIILTFVEAFRTYGKIKKVDHDKSK